MTQTVTNPMPRVSQKAATTTTTQLDPTSQLTEQLKELRLPTIRDRFQESAIRAATENQSHLAYLSELTTQECETRKEGRIKRLMTRCQLPPGKTWDSFDFTRLPLHVARQMESLRDGSFPDRRENILIFGKPGSGKNHALAALAEQLFFRAAACCLRRAVCWFSSC